ncbi:type IV pilus assembly PilZ [Dissulfuribacter thermophilus]|uniref:Type IV pilus assembly PilZ n=1 Tax=Dissulfuribacter thermophilus TaxID=1156395 RepID=A0A1B9F7G8_9BACT|nr:PilZ domain-containing protein [Dissulfuribacter thermophilus]OCC15866.1 type IV pilus assembly PilZ [Dissulfuribacter thermophilus]
MGIDKRKNLRVVFKTNCSVEPINGDLSPFEADSTKDISLKGMYIETENRLPIGSSCILILKLAGTSSELILSIRAKVARADSNGLAFTFEEIDMDSFFHLRNVLYYNSGDPDRIDKEIIDTQD